MQPKAQRNVSHQEDSFIPYVFKANRPHHPGYPPHQIMSFFYQLKSKVQQALYGNEDSNKTDEPDQPISTATPSHSAFIHNSQHLNFSKSHLQSQRAKIPQPGVTPPGPGTFPPKLLKHTYRPPMRFLRPSGHQHAVMRDLGFTGILDGRIIWTWGDTLMGNHDSCMICAVDSTSIGTLDAKGVTLDSAITPGTRNVANWIDCTPEEEADGGLTKYAFGGTNIVEYPVDSGRGVVYYLKNERPGGISVIRGAGIATVSIDDNNIPHSQRCGTTLWSEDEAWYGDVAAVLNAADNNIYVFGHGPVWSEHLNGRTFLARVPAEHATSLHAYEYWLNSTRSWTPQRQAHGKAGTARLKPEDAVFGWHVMNQATPFWSVYFGCWMVIHGSSWPASDVLCRTAAHLEGPWTDHGGLCSTAPRGDEVGFRYCITAHPEYDVSGKTVYVTWTRENVIYGVDLEWT